MAVTMKVDKGNDGEDEDGRQWKEAKNDHRLPLWPDPRECDKEERSLFQILSQ